MLNKKIAGVLLHRKVCGTLPRSSATLSFTTRSVFCRSGRSESLLLEISTSSLYQVTALSYFCLTSGWPLAFQAAVYDVRGASCSPLFGFLGLNYPHTSHCVWQKLYAPDLTTSLSRWSSNPLRGSYCRIYGTLH